ncbi:hypothetical protein AK812_SmicGene44057 [Symbiodinium microadriaticum]|uniref:Uncharacterized protein n=1 Tax=Symbiodinium microadriaticum TaxID=2951 RepID=A0A1Q9BZF6_SYMMI|nr:hypothetical protein AK812_SmicGene44057 [Symbiodinium microadriaticum]
MAAEVPVPSSDEDRAGSPKNQRLEHGGGTRRRESGGAVTLDDLRTLLHQQSESIAESQTRAIRGAVAELRAATAAELQGIKSELSRHADYISQLREQNDRLEARVLAVESQKSEGSTVYPGSYGGDAGHQKNLVILGGWDADTHKADLLPELEELLQRIGVRDQFQDIFTTGPRRGHAMGLVKWPTGVSEQELKRRLIRLVQEIRGASMAASSMPNGKTRRPQVFVFAADAGTAEKVCGHGSGLRCLSVVSGDADVCVCKWWWPCAAVVDGAALKVAERRKRATYPELERGGPQKLVVLGSEVGGRWNEQARRLVQDLVRLKGHRAPRALRAAASGAWARRWWSMLSVAVQQAVASKRPAQR